MNFYYCKHCKNVIIKLSDKNNVECCNEEMGIITPNTVDASQEKHVPVITELNGEIKVTVGSLEHPMEEKHYIEFIVLKEETIKIKHLKPGEKPEALFTTKTKKFEVYAYCNIHGLWKAN